MGMNNEEMWRQHAYQRSVGESGNSSMGTIANREGYNTYLARQKAANQHSEALFRDSCARGGVSYSSPAGSGSSEWFTFVDDLVDLLPGWTYWLLGLSGMLAGYGYVSHSIGSYMIGSSHVFFSHYAWPMALGLFGGLLVIPLIVFVVKLALTVVVLGLAAGAVYVGYMVYLNWPA
jgi:hypothetical protein